MSNTGQKLYTVRFQTATEALEATYDLHDAKILFRDDKSNPMTLNVSGSGVKLLDTNGYNFKIDK